ncbi:hypothetical protein K474DRAFT_744256 [Panus rudis PR-1116 ss-1]|nr:hypothetical protein K474DRAFT_744256 [Panus rudis PR-1116 ss-1]
MSDADPTPSHEPPQEIEAGPPFDDPTGDIILRSVDRVKFRVHKVILRHASTTFNSIFHSATADCVDPAHEDLSKPALPIIDVPETAGVLKGLLHCCYPLNPQPPIYTTLGEIIPMLEAASKYEMKGVLLLLEISLWRLHKISPISTYAVGCQFGFSELCKNAAMWDRARVVKRTGSFPAVGITWSATLEHLLYGPKRMQSISAGSYLRLIHYMRSGDVRSLAVPSFEAAPAISPAEDLSDIPVFSFKPESEADIVLCGLDGGKFPFRRSLFASLSTEFQTLLLQSENGATATTAATAVVDSNTEPMSVDALRTNLPVVEISEDSLTLLVLLHMCYPINNPDFSRFLPQRILKMMHVIRKYKLPAQCESLCRRHMEAFIFKRPFFAFHTALAYGWHEEARDAALYIARLQVAQKYHQDLEILNASHYYFLLKFCHHYYEALTEVVRVICIELPREYGRGSSSGSSVTSTTWTDAVWMWQDGRHQTGDSTWVLSTAMETTSAFRGGDATVNKLLFKAHEAVTKLQLESI